jgi:hypothetical protein
VIRRPGHARAASARFGIPEPTSGAELLRTIGPLKLEFSLDVWLLKTQIVDNFKKFVV